MPGLHAILSASAAKRWLACPPSARLEEKLKGIFGDASSPYAREGTQAHAVAELKLRREINEINDFSYLQATKDAIKNAITEKGVSVPDGTTFRDYASKIASIITDASAFNATWSARSETVTSAGEILLLGNGSNGPTIRPASEDLYLAMFTWGSGAYTGMIVLDFVNGFGQCWTSSLYAQVETLGNLIRYTSDIDANVYWSVCPTSWLNGQAGTLYLVKK